MSTTALHIIQLVQSLSEGDQKAIRDALTRPAASTGQPRRQLPRSGDGAYLNPDGIPNDDPVFQVLDEIEAQRHRTAGRPAPDFA